MDEWTLKIMTVLAYVCVFERVRAALRVCRAACVLKWCCYSYRLLIDPDNWQGEAESKAAIDSASERSAGVE